MDIYSYANNRRYIHYDNWVGYRNELCSYYPLQKGHFRADIELINPRLFLQDVPVERNPHGSGYFLGFFRPRYDAHTCFYLCDDWTTVFDIHDVSWQDGGDSYRFLIESNHVEPKGERVILYSTSCDVWNEPWGMNKSNHFAFFRNRFWYVSHIEFLHDRWKFCRNYPMRDKWKDWNNTSLYWSDDAKEKMRNSPECHQIDDYLLPSYKFETNDTYMHGCLHKIFTDPSDLSNYLFLADYLEERGNSFGQYLRHVIAIGDFEFKMPSEKLIDFYRTRPKNIRTVIFLVCNLLQESRSDSSFLDPFASNLINHYRVLYEGEYDYLDVEENYKELREGELGEDYEE